jgi:hypothetical protein
LTAWCKERLTKRSQLAYVVKLVLRWSRSLRVFYNFPIVPTWQFESQSLGYLNISKWGLKSYCSRVLRPSWWTIFHLPFSRHATQIWDASLSLDAELRRGGAALLEVLPPLEVRHHFLPQWAEGEPKSEIPHRNGWILFLPRAVK